MEPSKPPSSEDSDLGQSWDEACSTGSHTTKSHSNAHGNHNSLHRDSARKYGFGYSHRQTSNRAEYRERRSYTIDDDQAEPESKLEYDEGLYSPTNPEGHRRYSNKFLRAIGRKTRLNLEGIHAKIEQHSLDTLPYEAGQYSPTNPDGDKKYSMTFLKAVGEMLMPDEDAPDVAPLLSDRSIFPWDMNLSGNARHRGRTSSEIETSSPRDDIWL